MMLPVINARKILDKVQSRETKDRITVSVSSEVLEAFKKACDNRPISPIVEELMREFVASAESDKKKKP